jgi:hypothetical protein
VLQSLIEQKQEISITQAGKSMHVFVRGCESDQRESSENFLVKRAVAVVKWGAAWRLVTPLYMDKDK